MMREKIDVMKIVVLFITIHLMIAWVAERKEKKSAQRSHFTKAFDLTAGKTNKQSDPMKMQLDGQTSGKPLAAFQ
jgi:hypothetical protein